MVEGILKKLACPECDGTIFEVFLMEYPNFYSEEVVAMTKGSGTSMYTETEKCIKCGWTAHPTTTEDAREVLMIMLDNASRPSKSRNYPWKTYKIVEE